MIVLILLAFNEFNIEIISDTLNFIYAHPISEIFEQSQTMKFCIWFLLSTVLFWFSSHQFNLNIRWKLPLLNILTQIKRNLFCDKLFDSKFGGNSFYRIHCSKCCCFLVAKHGTHSQWKISTTSYNNNKIDSETVSN